VNISIDLLHPAIGRGCAPRSWAAKASTPIPDELLKGKERVAVRFEPVGNGQFGVLGCYVMREKQPSK
jgi:hypothetical protein